MTVRAAEPLTPAVLVVGLPGSGKSTFIRRHAGVLQRRAEIVVVNDADGLARRLRRPGGGRPVVVEARGAVASLDLIEVFTEASSQEHFFLADVVTVVDAARFLPLLQEEAADEGPDQTPGERIVDDIELASAVALENTGDAPDPSDQRRIVDLVRALNPAARLDGAGWSCSSPFDHDHLHHDGRWLSVPPPGSVTVDVFRYQARRPFHPARLAAALASGWTGVLRTKGFVWIATRGQERGVYIQTGTTWRLDGAGPWWASVPQGQWPRGEHDLQDIRAVWSVRTGDRRQELVFVGLSLRQDRIRRDLDSCLLGDREYAAGAEAWSALPDPLPSWEDQRLDEWVSARPSARTAAVD